MLSSAGRRILSGKSSATGTLKRSPFFTATNLLDRRRLDDCTKLLAKTFTDILQSTRRPLPPATSSPKSYQDTLPRVGTMSTVPLNGPLQLVALGRAKEIGLYDMVTSESYRKFAESLAGEPLDGPTAEQVLCFRPLDYTGPHTDHHPDEPRAKGGYIDVHVSFCTPGIKQQFIVYEQDGHFAQMAPISASGTVTAYRLPVWHYTTPLQARRAEDRRWLLLGSFYFKEPAA